jgi:hypothetical protein
MHVTRLRSRHICMYYIFLFQLETFRMQRYNESILDTVFRHGSHLSYRVNLTSIQKEEHEVNRRSLTRLQQKYSI